MSIVKKSDIKNAIKNEMLFKFNFSGKWGIKLEDVEKEIIEKFKYFGLHKISNNNELLEQGPNKSSKLTKFIQIATDNFLLEGLIVEKKRKNSKIIRFKTSEKFHLLLNFIDDPQIWDDYNPDLWTIRSLPQSAFTGFRGYLIKILIFEKESIQKPVEFYWNKIIKKDLQRLRNKSRANKISNDKFWELSKKMT